MATKSWGKWLGRTLVLALAAGIILLIVNWIMSAVGGLSTTWGTFLTLLFVIVFFGTAVKYRKGVETFMFALPTILVIMAVYAFLQALGIQFLDFVLEISWQGIAIAFGTVFFADAFVSKIKALN